MKYKNSNIGLFTHTADIANVMYNPNLKGEIALHVAEIVNWVKQQNYTPKDMKFFRYIMVNSLLKGEKKDNNNVHCAVVISVC